MLAFGKPYQIALKVILQNPSCLTEKRPIRRASVSALLEHRRKALLNSWWPNDVAQSPNGS